MSDNKTRSIAEIQVPVNMKLSLLWASLMSLYIYNDYFILFVLFSIEAMSAGSMGPLGDYTEAKMIAVAIVLIIPACMISLSSIASARVSRWLNIVLGSIYCVIAILTLIGSPLFYKLVVAFEIAATMLVVWFAYHWPKHDSN